MGRILLLYRNFFLHFWQCKISKTSLCYIKKVKCYEAYPFSVGESPETRRFSFHSYFFPDLFRTTGR